MPWMRVRVVCGLAVTMATFSPMSALTSVDLPALGRPMTETNPDRIFIGTPLCCFRQARNAEPVHATVGGRHNLKAQSETFHNFAGLRNAACGLADQAAGGGGLDIFRKVEVAEKLLDARNFQVSRHQPAS